MRTLRAIKYLIVAMLHDARTILLNYWYILMAVSGAVFVVLVKNKLTILISVGSITFISVGAIVYFADPRGLPPEPIRLPPCEQRCDEISIVDDKGQQGLARYYLGNWLLSEVGRVSDNDGNPLDVEKSHLPPPEVLNNSRWIVTIGVASFGEECNGGANREETRAAVRANRLAELVKDVVGNTVEIRTLNLGKYGQGPDAAEQRPAIIVCILQMSPNFNVVEAILPSLNAVFSRHGVETGARTAVDISNFSLVRSSRIEFGSPDGRTALEACASGSGKE